MRLRLPSHFVTGFVIAASCSLSASLFSTPVDAQTEAVMGRIKTVRQALTVDPGGRKRGELYTNAPVQIIEERGAWVKVRTEGWVRKNSVATSEKTINPKNATALNESGFALKSYFVRYESSKGDSPRMYVDLTLANFTKKPIYRWRALLVGKDTSGKLLFSEVITDDSADFKPGETKKVSFYWKNGEAPYEPLKSAKDDTSLIKLEITKVSLTQE